MFVFCAGQFGRVFYASLVRPGNKVEEQVAVKTMKCTLNIDICGRGCSGGGAHTVQFM